MKILLDNGVPRGLVRLLVEHAVEEARAMGWEELANGDLIEAAETSGFERMITNDKNMSYQQNLSKRRIALIVLGNSQWPMVQLAVAEIRQAVGRVGTGTYEEVPVPFKTATDA